jgi:hypothetical protein
MRQLIETDERDLRSLPVEDGLVVLEVGERNRGAGWKAPIEVGVVRFRAKQRVKLEAFVPEAAFIGDLRRCAAKDDGAEGRIVDVADRLEQLAEGFASTTPSRTTVNRYVGGARQEATLGAGLGANLRWRVHRLCGSPVFIRPSFPVALA